MKQSDHDPLNCRIPFCKYCLDCKNNISGWLKD